MLSENSKRNLVSLLNTPSPSGDEVKIQKMWMKLVKKYSDKLETDLSGNAISILNPDADFKIEGNIVNITARAYCNLHGHWKA